MQQRICNAKYTRPQANGGEEMFCTFPVGHESRANDETPHSWYWAQAEDEVCDDTEALSDVEVLIENISAGKADPYLEAILAAAHGRKRALRNVQYPYGTRERRR